MGLSSDVEELANLGKCGLCKILAQDFVDILHSLEIHDYKLADIGLQETERFLKAYGDLMHHGDYVKWCDVHSEVLKTYLLSRESYIESLKDGSEKLVDSVE